jgi:hypothetical protein
MQTRGYLSAMSVKTNSSHLILLGILLFLLPYAYGGCFAAFSSGDGHKDRIIADAPDDTEDGFSGGFIIIVTQASVGPQNAQALTGLAIRSDPTSIQPEQAELNPSSVDTGIATYRPWDFTLVLGYSLRHIQLSPTLFGSSQADTISESGTVDGSCGGFFSYSLDLNRVSEEFGGSLSFEDYCDGRARISGDADVLGAFDVNTGDLLTATFSFDNLVAGSFTLDGELSIDFSDPPIIAVFTVHVKDTVSGLVYWLKDYSMNITEWVGGVEIEFMGTFYHPDHGFVDLATTDPFVIHDEDDWPASGQMVIEGDNGTGALLTAIDHMQCGIKADTTGNGIYEWDSGILNWTDL